MKTLTIPLALLMAALFTGPARAQKASEATTLLKPNDVVRLEVFDEPELAKQIRIDKDGHVSFPLIETVKIGGLTVRQATDTIRNLYISEEYLVDPKVTLTVDDYSQDFISVIGAVKTTGQLPMPASGKLDLNSAIAGAGGVTPDADVNRIVLTRGGKATTYSMASLRSKQVALQPGDQIEVQQSLYVNKTVIISGTVGKAGPVPFPVDGRLDLVTAIALAGGFTELSNQKTVKVNRKGQVSEINVKEMTDKGSKPYYLQPDDIVTVKERAF